MDSASNELTICPSRIQKVQERLQISAMRVQNHRQAIERLKTTHTAKRTPSQTLSTV